MGYQSTGESRSKKDSTGVEFSQVFEVRPQTSASKIADRSSECTVECALPFAPTGRNLDIFSRHERESQGSRKEEVTLFPQ